MLADGKYRGCLIRTQAEKEMDEFELIFEEDDEFADFDGNEVLNIHRNYKHDAAYANFLAWQNYGVQLDAHM